MQNSSTPVRVKFQNQANPHAGFDLIRLEDLYQRRDLDHSPFQPHVVEFFIIILIETGRGVHTIDFNEYSFHPGTLLTIRKDQLHKFHLNSGIRGNMLLFTNEFLVSYLEAGEALKSFQLFNEVLTSPKVQLSPVQREVFSGILGRIAAEYTGMHDAQSLSIIRSELQILIAKLYRLKANSTTILRERKYLHEFLRLQELIERHVTEHKQVQQYARLLGVSSRTLSNVTRSIVHKSAKAFIDEIGTKQIKRLLINTELSIKEIAYTSGFAEPTNFYKYFKRQTGLTPEQFRTQVER
ncbi:MAG: AraC family transcriptional regulator [Bacteroidota bacterium]